MTRKFSTKFIYLRCNRLEDKDLYKHVCGGKKSCLTRRVEEMFRRITCITNGPAGTFLREDKGTEF